MGIVGPIRWSQRQKLCRLARRSREPIVVRRALAVAQLARGRGVGQEAEALSAARSTVYLWARWFREGGIDALLEERRGSARRTVTEKVLKEMESLLETTPQTLGYPSAKRLLLILDNYGVHKSHKVNTWLASHPRIELLFQPAYHPWVNRIERLWKAMHDTVTRNHRCRTLEELCAHVARFLEVVQPFPGAGHACATMAV